MFIKRYSNISEGPKQWQKIKLKKQVFIIGTQDLLMLRNHLFLKIYQINLRGLNQLKMQDHF